MNKPIEKVCVVGAGSAGLLSAVAFKRLIPGVDVTVVYSSKIPVVGVGESTTDIFPRFLHNQLQLDRKQFFTEVRPSWKFGVRFLWGQPHIPHFNYGFDQVFTARSKDLRLRGASYCLDDPTDSGYFGAFMDRDVSPLVSYEGQYQMLPGGAYHIPNARFLAYMKRVAEELGVRFVDGNVLDVEQDERGNVTRLKLDGADDVSADLFIDCSGYSSLLLNKTLGQKFVSFSDTLFCDRAAIGSWNRDDAIRPHTTTETMDSGWCWRIEFPDAITRGYVYSSQFISDDDAVAEIKSKNPELGEDIRIIKFPSGRYENYFVKNVIAIGNSSGFVEPLEATALHLVAVQLSAACGALLDSNCMIQPLVQNTINQQFRTMWDDVRDFSAVHYKFNKRLDTPFWKHCREHTGLGGAESLWEMWRESGPHRLGEACLPRESIFRHEGYLTMLIGQRVETEFKSELTEQDRADWEAHRNRIRNFAEHALPVREALQIVTDPGFQWPEA